MGKQYGHLSIEERCEIARLHAEGVSGRQIAASLDRSPSTISRELSRNGSKTKGYDPGLADERAWARRWRGSKLERDAELREEVLGRLKAGLSPEEVCGRLELEYGRKRISHETIYRFVHGQLARTKDYRWRMYLPRGKSKRGWRGRKGGSPASFIALRRSLWERAEEVEGRGSCGHWEVDLMQFGRSGPVVLAMQERKSRMLAAVRLPGKGSEGVAEAMCGILEGLPPQLRRTATFDNGTEFALHYRLHELGVETFFCDVRSPWQKGGVENAIGRLRRWLPRKTKLEEVTDEEFAAVIWWYNNTPRKCLGYYSPAEIFERQVLHLKCEFTFLLSQE